MVAHKHPVNQALRDKSGPGDRATEALSRAVGSWRFVIIQNVIVLLWGTFNAVAIFRWHWDPYPFILLNLVFSWQASNTGPVLQMAQNRQSEHDRLKAEHDYQVNENTNTLTREVRDLTAEVHRLTVQQMDELAGIKHANAELNLIRQAVAPGVPNPETGMDPAPEPDEAGGEPWPGYPELREGDPAT